MASKQYRSYAKINTCLVVTGTSADGYHNISTIFQSISLHDIVSIDQSSGAFAFSCSDSSLPVDDTNLVVKAVRLWEGATGIAVNSRIYLEKQIPVSAGLGGGSSNAAATLMALNSLHDYPLTPTALADCALDCGSDVPYFLHGGRMLGTGRGQVLQRLPDTERLELLLIKPVFGVSAREAYDCFDLTSRGRLENMARIRSCASGTEQGQWHNDLEWGVVHTYPEIDDIRRTVSSAGATQVLMSGSGSTVVGAFHTAVAADAALQTVCEQGEQQWSVFRAHTIGARHYRESFVLSESVQ